MKQTFPKDREEKRKFLLDAVESVRDVVEASADEAEQIRTLPKAAVDAIYDAGLFSMKLPEVLGGAEADPVTMIEVIEAMTYIDTSAGWATMIGSISVSRSAAFLLDEAIEEMFANKPIPKSTGVVAPPGTAIRQNGGYIVNGHWAFASGVLHSDWVFGFAEVQNTQRNSPEFRMIVMPTDKVKIHDNWHVAGLRGTGSCDISVSDLFVPDIFTWDVGDEQPKRGGPSFKITGPGVFTGAHIGFALGVARRALDEIIEAAKTKKRGRPPSPLADRSYFQLVIGECELKLRAARGLAMEIHERAWETVSSGETLGLSQQVEMRASATYVTEVARDVVFQAFQFAGASALHNSNILQRCHRDIAAAAQHRLMDNVAYELYGKVTLGRTDVNPMG